MGATLRFNKNKTFKIVQFTDIHWTDGNAADLETKKLMEGIIQDEEPDLIVFTGDTIYGPEVLNSQQALHDALSPVGDIPFLFTFGNHDTEGGGSKEVLGTFLSGMKGSLFAPGPQDLYGSGNYAVEVLGNCSDEPAWILYCLDSGMMNLNNTLCEEYEYITSEQINWYVETSKSYWSQYPDHNSLAFFHIPLMEYQRVWDSGSCVGHKRERICSPKQNSGFFSAALEQGNMKGIFVGHDHINDFNGALQGIRLVYGRLTGYNSYGEADFSRGARIIELFEGSHDFKTWLRLESGRDEFSQKRETVVTFQNASESAIMNR